MLNHVSHSNYRAISCFSTHENKYIAQVRHVRKGKSWSLNSEGIFHWRKTQITLQFPWNIKKRKPNELLKQTQEDPSETFGSSSPFLEVNQMPKLFSPFALCFSFLIRLHSFANLPFFSNLSGTNPSLVFLTAIYSLIWSLENQSLAGKILEHDKGTKLVGNSSS